MRRSGACATNPGCAAMGTLRQRSALITSTARRAVSCAHPGSKAAAAAAGPRPDPLVSRTGVFSCHARRSATERRRELLT